MATAPVQPKRRIKRSRQQPNLVVLHGGKELSREEGSAELLRVSSVMRSRVQVRISKLPDAPDRRSVANAMLMVEIRLAKAFWTIARLPAGTIAPLGASRNGVDYVHDREDTHARYADAPSGKWEAVAPRPSLPSSKDIDAANQALEWLLLIEDEGLRKVLVVGATAKRGDAGRRIPWIRLKPCLPQYRDATVRTMQRHYAQALRIIVTEMTIARMSRVSHK